MVDERVRLPDAHVLLDYLEADPAILSLACAHLGKLMVPTCVREQIAKHLRCSPTHVVLGITLLNESHSTFAAAAAPGMAHLAFHDRVLVVLARKRGHSVLSNDPGLLTTLANAKVPAGSGWDLLVELVERQHLALERAVEVIQRIGQTNRCHQPEAIAAVLRRLRVAHRASGPTSPGDPRARGFRRDGS